MEGIKVGDTLVPCTNVYKHRDQRLGTMVVTQCVYKVMHLHYADDTLMSKELLSYQKIIENTCTLGRPFIQVYWLGSGHC